MQAVSNDVVIAGEVPARAVAGAAHEAEARSEIERAIGVVVAVLGARRHSRNSAGDFLSQRGREDESER
jgi:hypothetical protein